MKPKTTAIVQLGIVALILALFLSWCHLQLENKKNKAIQVAQTASTTEAIFTASPIEAKSAYVYDVFNKKPLYQKNADEKLPLASITKIMSAYTASKLVQNFMVVRISTEDINKEGDSGLFSNELWNVKKLIDYSLMVSSNDGMHAIASIAGSQIAKEPTTTPSTDLFINEMNKNAREIGLKNTEFLNESGLDLSETLSGAYGSAKDIAMLLDYILKKDAHLLEATSLTKSTIESKDFPHVAQNTDKSIPNIPNLIASKTGFTDLSGGNLIIAFNAGINRPIVISVLGSSYDGRFTDMNSLVKATLEYLSQK